MIVVNTIQAIAVGFTSMTRSSDIGWQWLWQLPVNWTVVAQTIKDPNILGSMQKAFTHFVASGQVWALLIGLALGYLLRSFTTYG